MNVRTKKIFEINPVDSQINDLTFLFITLFDYYKFLR